MEPDRLNHLLDHATGTSGFTAPAGSLSLDWPGRTVTSGWISRRQT